MVCSLTTKFTATVQSISIYVNVLLISLFLISVPVGTKVNLHKFNNPGFIFGLFQNSTTWTSGWAFMLSCLPAIWTIGAYDSCIHMTEECKDPTRKVPIGIIGSISVCWMVGWCICITICACIKDGDVEAVLSSPTGMVVAQIVTDSLGPKWAIAFMSIISIAQYMMSISLLIALSRQVFSFARDHGLPVVYNYVKVINPKIKVPVRATIFSGIFGCVLAMLILINSTAANALFSMGVIGNIAFGVPILLVVLPTKSAKRFVPGPFYSKRLFYPIKVISFLWLSYNLVMFMFPSGKNANATTMNYACAIDGGIILLSMVYFFLHGYKHYHGPKSNLTANDGKETISEVIEVIDNKLV